MSPELAEREPAGAVAAGLGAGATVVFGPDVVVLVLQAARILLYHLVQSVVVDVVSFVVFTAPGDLPDEVCAPAVLHAALFALPAFVQSYWRVVVVATVLVVVVRAGVAAFEDVDVAAFDDVDLAVLDAVEVAAPLQAALFALPAFEQS